MLNDLVVFFFCDHVICEQCAKNIEQTLYKQHNTNNNWNYEIYILEKYACCPYCRANTDIMQFNSVYYTVGPDLYNFDFNTLEIDELRNFARYDIDTFI